VGFVLRREVERQGAATRARRRESDVLDRKAAGYENEGVPDAGVAAETRRWRRICRLGDATAADASDAASRLLADALAPDALHLARRIAEAQVDLKRVRLARHRLLASRFGDGDFGKTISGEKPNEIKETRSEATGPQSGAFSAVPEPPGRPDTASTSDIDPAKQFPAVTPMKSEEIDLAGGGRHIRGECSAPAAHAAVPPTCPGRMP
jgi:hypothetical protein